MNKWKWSMRFDVKPLSINVAYYRNRAKSAKYMAFHENIYDYLVGHELPTQDPDEIKKMRFKAKYHWGFSSRASDLDNPLKAMNDVLQQHFGYDDKQIWCAEVSKEIVKRGTEFCYVELETICEEEYQRSLVYKPTESEESNTGNLDAQSVNEKPKN